MREKAKPIMEKPLFLLRFQHIRPQILASFSHPNPQKKTP